MLSANGKVNLFSETNLNYVFGEVAGGNGEATNVHKGLKLGLSLQTDTRDRRAYPTSGTLLELTGWHYFSRNDLDVSFSRFKAEGHAFIGLGGENVLAFRALGEITDSDGSDPIPFYLLPEVDFSSLGGYKRHRFVDNDRVGYRAVTGTVRPCNN